MPKYRITNDQTGQSLIVERDKPPSPQDSSAAFQSAAPQELVSGNTLTQIPGMGYAGQQAASQEQMNAISARNLQAKLGLSDPVSTTQTLPLSDILKASFAPTADEQTAYLKVKFGEGNYKVLSADNIIAKVPTGDGKFEWRPINKPGLDMSDLARLPAAIPSMLASAGAAARFTPAGGLARASGAQALASQGVGAAEDVAFRMATGTDINPGEIAARRAPMAVAEFLGGLGLSKLGDFIGTKVAQNQSVKNYLGQFSKAGNAAKSELEAAGFTANSAGDLADAMLAANSQTQSPSDAGSLIAKGLNDMDKRLSAASTRSAFSAANQMEAAAMAPITAMSRLKTPLTPAEAGKAAIGSAKNTFTTIKDALQQDLTDALLQIDTDAAKSGAGRFFVKLNNTSSLLDQIESNLPINDKGEIVEAFLPSSKTVNSLKEMVGVGQGIQQMRDVRTAIGSKLSGANQEMFPGFNQGQLKAMYAAISKDIDESVSAFSGTGADKLKQYNANYKKLIGSSEDNSFVSKIVNSQIQNPEEIVDYLAKNGGTEDWKAISNVLDKNTFNKLRQTVATSLIDSERTQVAGGTVANIPSLAKTVRAMDPEVKTVIFGKPQVWQLIERAGNQIEALSSNRSVFAGTTLPSMSDLEQILKFGQSGDIVAGQMKLTQAIRAASERRSNMNDAIASQVRNGNLSQVAGNPAKLLDVFLFSDNKFNSSYVKKTLDKLSESDRDVVSKSAFEAIFEKARDSARSTVDATTNRYDAAYLAEKMFGTKNQREIAKQFLGEDKYSLLENWITWNAKIAADAKKSAGRTAAVARIASVAPYGTLVASRLAQSALNGTAGAAFLSNSSPANMALYNAARLSATNPVKTSAGIALVQKAMETVGYGDYIKVMENYKPDEQQAIDDYLSGLRDK